MFKIKVTDHVSTDAGGVFEDVLFSISVVSIENAESSTDEESGGDDLDDERCPTASGSDIVRRKFRTKAWKRRQVLVL